MTHNLKFINKFRLFKRHIHNENTQIEHFLLYT